MTGSEVICADGPMDGEADMSELFPTVERIKVSRLTLGHDSKTPKVGFNLGVDLQEVEARAGRSRLRYTLYVYSYPALQQAEIAGMITIPSRAITGNGRLALSQDRISEVAIRIYRQNYETLYLLLKSISLEAPPPWLVRDVHLVDAPEQDQDRQAEQMVLPEIRA